MDSKEIIKLIQDNDKRMEQMRNSGGMFKAIESVKQLESLKIPKVPTTDYFQHRELDASGLNATLDSIQKSKAEEKRRESEYKESVLSSLQGIEKNTALLTEMTSLLQTSNEKQAETFELMVEILEIMKSKDQEEADTKFTAVTKKITAFADNANTLHSLINMAGTVYGSLPF
ncbi:vacuolar-type H+-ATPase subunit I/STV1 [Peribacillus sp. B2I2]|uniref:hypothetical protein n=1 Tax=Peribacillus sp. B2I2 TaxID=3156468 RepID=UPI0035111A33